MADFDPDAYLANGAAPSGGPSFDPDAYLGTPAQGAGDVVGDIGKQGAKGVVRGAEGFAGDMGEAVMGPFGPSHHLSNLIADLGLGERKAPEATYGSQLADATGMKADPKSTLGKFAGTIGETLGNPATYFGPGGLLEKMLLGTASAVGSEGAGEVTEGTPWEGPARTAGALLAGPLAARMMKPELAPAQQSLVDAGVTQLTPGQLTGGMFKKLEDKMTSFPILGDFIENGRGRSIESYNKAVANQALEPIGEKLGKSTPAGHQAVDEVATKLGDAYDNLVPKLSLNPDKQYWADIKHIYDHNVQMLPEAQINQFEKIMAQRLGRPGPLQGAQVKTIESELNYLAGKYGQSSDAAQQLMGDSIGDVVKAIRSNLERTNPQYAAQLRNINSGWAMYARMRMAAANRVTSEGVFTPGDLLSVIKRGDKSVQKGSFARGDALMQDFAEAGQKVLPSKIPDSGTAGRTMANIVAGGGAAYLDPKLLAGVAAASVPYLTPSMALLNKYVKPTTGWRADYANAARGLIGKHLPYAGTIRPFLQNGVRPLVEGSAKHLFDVSQTPPYAGNNPYDVSSKE
jgi:hypothetical protein